jgi:hypothetical protein
MRIFRRRSDVKDRDRLKAAGLRPVLDIAPAAETPSFHAIDADAAEGKLDRLADEAVADYREGRAREL